jgi:hypothetical protein
LRRLYADPALAAADVALLHRLVPGGCRLLGVESRFSRTAVHAAGDRATVVVTATQPPARLTCGNRVRGVTAASPPRRMRFVLVRGAAGVRIAGRSLA